MSTAAAPTTRVESVLQRAELELWRDNIDGALDLLARAHTLAPDHRYAARAEEIRSWLRHLESRGAYAAAYEEYYRRSKGRLDLKRLERDVRILLGRKTRKTVRRVVEYPEYQLLEREIIERRPARVLDAGCGEGRIALCLGHRCPSIRVTAVEVSASRGGSIASATWRFSTASSRTWSAPWRQGPSTSATPSRCSSTCPTSRRRWARSCVRCDRAAGSVSPSR